jgi:ATP-dependent DNA helicase DinG
LAQGAGRLIRSTADRGVVAVFDSRLLRKQYGQTLLASLPPLFPTREPDRVVDALERLVAGLPDTPSAWPGRRRERR